MKAKHPISRSGFTLMELMVAMAITTIIVTALVSITSIAIDTWNRSRSELRASRMGKTMIDYMARDLESLVTRRGNPNEWLSAIVDTAKIGPATMQSTNASRLIFFTAATDRYDGNVGIPKLDDGGDVCCVAYMLKYKKPILVGTSTFETFVLSRKLVNPDKTFTELLGETTAAKSLDNVFVGIYSLGNISNPGNYVCENLYQFSIAFHVQVTDSSVTPPTSRIVRVAIGSDGTTSFRIFGSEIITDYSGADSDLVPSGRVVAAEIFATVLSDFGIEQIQDGKRTFSDDKTKAEFLAKNSYSFSKMVRLPGM